MATRIIKPKVKTGENAADDVKIPYSVISNPPDLSKFADITADETITGAWKFVSAPKMNTLENENGNEMYHFNGERAFFGQTTSPVTLRGSLERPQYTTDGENFSEIALKSDITGGGSTAVAEQVTIATGDWVLDGAQEVPNGLIAVNDVLTTLQVNNQVTPDFTAFDWSGATTEDGITTLILIATTKKLNIKKFPQGFEYDTGTFLAADNYYMADSSGTIYYMTSEIAQIEGVGSGGWLQNGAVSFSGTVTAVNQQSVWSAYISKNGWKTVVNSTIPPFAYRATKTIGTEMGANSVVSLGYADNPSMRECASAGVAIGEVPLTSGNEITFYSVTKPTKAINLVVEVGETTTNA